MSMNITRETLLEPLQTVIGVVEQKQTLPILSNILLEIKDSELSITATDLEVELIGKSNLLIKPEGNQRITLPAKKLSDITKSLPANSVIQLHKKNEQMIIQSGKSRFALSTLPPTDFPSLDKIKPVTSFNIQQRKLSEILQRTLFAMSQQDVRYYLNGVLLEITPDNIKAVATDGHRLAINSVPAVNSGSSNGGVIQAIIPRKAVLQLTKILHANDGEVNISVGNNFLRAICDEYVFTTRLVDGRYPEYNRVIPKNTTKEILVITDEFKRALQRSAILSNEKFSGVKLEFRRNSLKILANNPEHEAAEEELAIDYEGENLNIGFNVNYLVENINIFKKENIKLLLSNENSPMVIEEVGTEHDSTFVIMPLRL
jgi:DNA polymerase III subunit beta